MWLHSEGGNLDAYLAVLECEQSKMKDTVMALANEVSLSIYNLKGEEKEELKEEDKEWITKGYVEDNEPD